MMTKDEKLVKIMVANDLPSNYDVIVGSNTVSTKIFECIPGRMGEESEDYYLLGFDEVGRCNFCICVTGCNIKSLYANLRDLYDSVAFYTTSYDLDYYYIHDTLKSFVDTFYGFHGETTKVKCKVTRANADMLYKQAKTAMCQFKNLVSPERKAQEKLKEEIEEARTRAAKEVDRCCIRILPVHRMSDILDAYEDYAHSYDF